MCCLMFPLLDAQSFANCNEALLTIDEFGFPAAALMCFGTKPRGGGGIGGDIGGGGDGGGGASGGGGGGGGGG